MTVTKYNIINPVINPKMPFFDYKKGIFYFPVNTPYRFYVEVSNTNEQGDTEYYFLLGKYKFDNNCRTCHVDNYGRCQIKPQGELKEFIIRECKERGNINVDFYDSDENYDVWYIN